MHPHRHVHRYLRRTPDVFSDIKAGLSAINPFTNDGSSGTGSGDGGDGSGSSSTTTAGSGSSGGGSNQNTQSAPTPATTSDPGINNSNNKNGQGGDGGDSGDGSGDSSDATTITHVVYKTESPTFEGTIAGYSTIEPDQGTADQPQPTGDSPLPSMISSPTGQNVPTNLQVTNTATAAGHGGAQNTGGTIPTATSGISSSADSSSNGGSGGTSTAAKAGIAIGVLAGILLIFIAVFYAFNKRRRANKERMPLEEDDEKINSSFGAGAIPHSEPTEGRAPRISLRPVTQFLPNLNTEGRSNRGPNAALAPTAAAGAIRGQGQSMWERPIHSSQSNNPANPFGITAERVPDRVPAPIAEEFTGQNRAVSPISPVSPIDKPLPQTFRDQPAYDPTPSYGPTMGEAAAAGAVAGAIAAGTLTRKASIHEGPQPLDLTIQNSAPLAAVPGSPAGTEFSTSSLSPGHAPGPSTSAAAIAAAGGPTASAVHRVQLDFKPTLKDEMELRAGQLVRLIHEYDDGWALCLRLDRSEQGVVPRTCLSTRPVKPRQNGPRMGPPVNPSGPGPRGPGPNYPPNQRHMGPPGPGGPGYGPGPHYRPQSPSGRSMSPHGGRPASPAGNRSQSPGPRYQGPPGGRSQSPSQMNRRMSPPGPSRMNPQMNPQGGSPPQQRPFGSGPPTGPVGRKPVPGPGQGPGEAY